ncbi:SidA/IucD/PvdA family monooxygenase [Cronobacter sakazakii]|uniref:SidA/IucD/PvdA family monooxygenase n=2 Tax=Cronobacter sakazakii TaxID=28141 RepID=A0A7V7RC08_CROSK|nr:SidA/IucD/PvdA family monooxygenase [Cronobacter sakazakii]CCK10021.1 L-lysine 6-monooxygenase [NADPH], aerobactin biosynthesis protein IucD @ Siderophore biosynthesis protein, monooxygenase [Cronobacter sakazakii 680]AKE97345.1 aerobactin siderphore biosynthesis protein IucC [Cronobacter sakazakii]AXW99422.2 SidA/IucD/PvdA family monooxygenase [Cronobacter sakazakii]EGT4268809.1 lysine 6-monooxygenase [Cronobacter sakazakii]EGT4285654.1 lysine 6-monooxygenase [Cronobacter sakazakii]
MKTYDFIGIGIGPFNLSIAALAEGLDGFSSLFLERKPHFSWHPGMMVPDCHMQTSFLKDLVSAVEPTNRYSFLNYLVQRKKFYRFLTTEQRTVSREEFADYLCWAADNLSNLSFSQQVQQVSFNEASGLFEVVTQRDRFFARHVCMGIGKQVNLPDCVPAQNDHCFHASEMMLRTPSLAGKRVTVVGGGQSGADLFLNIFRGEWGQPAALNWVSRRNNYNALDEAAFANEYFTPEYLESFATLDEKTRCDLLAEQKMTSDGVTCESLLAIYRAMYHRFEVLREKPWAQLLPSRSVTRVTPQAQGQRLSLRHHLDGGQETLDTDVVIFATGYRPARPAFLAPLAHRLELDEREGFRVNTDFTLAWNGPGANHLFAVNAGMHSLGIAEPQLSLMAWRAARILNVAHPDTPFELSTTPGVIQWLSRPETVTRQVSQPVNSTDY